MLMKSPRIFAPISSNFWPRVLTTEGCADFCQLFQIVCARRQPKCAMHCFFQLNTTLLFWQHEKENFWAFSFNKEMQSQGGCLRVRQGKYLGVRIWAGWESEVRVERGKVVVSNYAQVSKQPGRPSLGHSTTAIKQAGVLASNFKEIQQRLLDEQNMRMPSSCIY